MDLNYRVTLNDYLERNFTEISWNFILYIAILMFISSLLSVPFHVPSSGRPMMTS